MTILRYKGNCFQKLVPYFNTPQRISVNDGLEYRIIYDDEYPGFYYHLEHRQVRHPMEGLNDVAWMSEIQNLEDHVSSCHFISTINRMFNTEFICADGERECTDETMRCDRREI